MKASSGLTLILGTVLCGSLLAVPVRGFAEDAAATAKPGLGGTASQDTKPSQDAKPGQDRDAAREDWRAKRMADRQAFFSARIAALHAGLQLKPEQEPLWAPVEAAMRHFATMRADRWREARRGGQDDGHEEAASSLDRLRAQAGRLVERGEAMRKLAEATGPLLAGLTVEQKDRLPPLLQGIRPERLMARAFDLSEGRAEGREGMGRGAMRFDPSEREGGERFARHGFEQDGGMDRHADRDRDDQDHEGFAYRDRPDDHDGDRGHGYDRRDRAEGGYGERQADRDDDARPMPRRHHHDEDRDDEGMSFRS